VEQRTGWGGAGVGSYGITPREVEPEPTMAVRGPREGSLSVRVVGSLVPPCSEPECERAAAFELHVPWAENRAVCAPHARVLARRDGVVADALPDADEELP
jgi:hypothetical protein